MIVIGGAREVLCIKEDKVELVLANRKGFCKKALVHGYDSYIFEKLDIFLTTGSIIYTI